VAVLRSIIRGVGAHLPKTIVTNDDLAKRLDTSDEWIQERSGIKQRHIADDNELTSDLRDRNARPHVSRDRR
jgi:3-oxoacyl-[acyl-carrier-protein] synthase III